MKRSVLLRIVSVTTSTGETEAMVLFRSANLLYESLRVVLTMPIRALWLKKVEGLANVPAAGGAILACNHDSYLDFLIVPVSGCRLPCYLIGDVFLAMPLVGWSFRKMGFIPIDRRPTANPEAVGQQRAANAKAIRAALNRLNSGELVGVFPEGTRSPDGQLQRAHRGIAILAHMSEAPVIPVAVIGTYEAWPKSRRFPVAGTCEVRFGKPLRFRREEYKGNKDVLASTTRTIMASIACLAGEDYQW